MFTPNEIEAIPLNLEKTFRNMESRVMADIVRKLRDNGAEITRAADWQIHRLFELGKTKEEIKAEIQHALNLSDEEINRLYNEVLQAGYARNEELYNAVGKNFIPYEDNKELKQLVSAVKKQTKNECTNITNSLGFAVRKPDGKLAFKPIAKYYQDTLDGGLMDIATGVFDYNTVLKRVVKEMTNSGLRSVDYASGWSNRVEVASRRAILTGFNQVVAQINESNAEELDTDYFEVSYHGGARPSHQEWQGKVYTKEQLESVCGLGEVTGLCGANCYHSYNPFIMGVSERLYTDEELDRMNREENTPKEYMGKEYTRYEALQKQRRMETLMRAQRQEIKLLKEGGADEEDITNATIRYRGTSAEYARFSKAMGLPQQRERVTIDGLNNIGNIKNNKSLENLEESGIIKREEETNVDYYKRLVYSQSKIEQNLEHLDFELIEIENKFYNKYNGFYDEWEDTVKIEFNRAGDAVRAKIDRLDTKLKSIIQRKSSIEIEAVKEIAEEIKQCGGFESVKISGCTFNSANTILEAVNANFQRLPKLKGTIRELRLENISDLNDYAFTKTLIGKTFKTDSICLNKNLFSNIEESGILDMLKKSVIKNYHPVGCDTPHSIITHEMGHVIENYQRNNVLPLLYYRNKRKLFKDIGIDLDDVVKDKSIIEGLSEYATAENGSEFVAEAWSEFICNPNPRPIAKSVGEFIIKQII